MEDEPHARRTTFIDSNSTVHIPCCFSAPSFSPTRKAAASVPSGAEVVFHTHDAAYERLSRNKPGDRAPTMEEVNAVTGPLAVEDALPGDALRVDILDVHIRRCWSVWTADEAVSGCLACKLAATGRRAAVRMLDIDDVNRTVQISARLRVPLEPMIGCIATAPEPHEGCSFHCGCSTFEPTFKHGGNMDLRELSIGSSILLPVQNKGALLFIGDLHACMVGTCV
jgi:amidase